MEFENIKIKDIKEYSHNAKIHTPTQIGKIRDSIQQYGYVDFIAIDENDEIIEGHGRLKALKQLISDGEKEIKVIRLRGLDEKKKRAYRIAHNRITLMTGFDLDALKEEFTELLNAEYDLAVTGFSEKEISKLTAEGVLNLGEDNEEDEPTPEANASHVRMVQLLLSREQNEEFERYVKILSARNQTDTVSDTVRGAVDDFNSP